MHRNSNQNQEPHHLYEVWDNQEEEVFKYGISSEPIEEDGLSKRIKEQLRDMNLAVGWLRYIARILLTSIMGRLKAKELEDEHMDAFELEKGRLPRGNLKRNRKK
ncbi:hypothetical protein [Haliscomenobacter hydrossis]|uniref:Tox-URI2 domain-containing protein n=1 Tax=Haliscomenobacter hydrossis (strain ATCC 27775 / DSM 1100 / LMG 10767 / O) TaxID=760192 RepID=F4L242_HALH1|nr:hypothetical protein [Haliscomenobacter hydrossis]AEE51649.1 hypothetical protein Halhy_3797 [Haliscomenobacter hydrossis DSM 1100]